MSGRKWRRKINIGLLVGGAVLTGWFAIAGRDKREDSPQFLRRGETPVDFMAISANGAMMAFAGSQEYEGQVSLYAKDGQGWRYRFALPMRGAEADCVALSPDGTRVAAANSTAVYVWDTASGNITGKLSKPLYWWFALKFRPDGAIYGFRVQTGPNSEKGVLEIWNIGTGTRLRVVRHGEPIEKVVLSADGATLATFGYEDSVDGKAYLRLWNVATGDLKRTITTDSVFQIPALSRNGSLAATGGDNGAEIWDTETGKMLYRFPLPEERENPPQYVLAFSPNDRHIAVGVQFPESSFLESLGKGFHYVGQVAHWDIREEKLLSSMSAYREGMESLTYSTDGRQLWCVASPRSCTVKRKLLACSDVLHWNLDSLR